MKADCQHCQVHLGDIGDLNAPGPVMKWCPYCGERLLPHLDGPAHGLDEGGHVEG